MGTTCPESPPLLQDLRVTIHETSMVFPSKETEKRSLFLSNIDKVLNFEVETVHFFGANKDFPPQKVAKMFKNALEDALVVYDFLGGRLNLNPETKRLEIDCNAKGAGFVVASSEYKLSEIGHLVYPNPSFAQFVHKSKDFLQQNDQPLCVAQVQYCFQSLSNTFFKHILFYLLKFASIIPCNKKQVIVCILRLYEYLFLIKMNEGNIKTYYINDYLF